MTDIVCLEIRNFSSPLFASTCEHSVNYKKALRCFEWVEVAEYEVFSMLGDGSKSFVVSRRGDGVTGEMEFKDLRYPEVDDLLDDLGEIVFNTSGRVAVVLADRTSTRTHEATCRF